MWKQLYAELTAKLWSERDSFVRKPHTRDIVDFQTKKRFCLPVSYREFSLVFGPGRLARYFFFPAPGYPDYGDLVDLWLFTGQSLSSQPMSFLTEVYQDADRISRMVFFSITEGVESIGWDPLDVRNPDTHEYGIYLIEKESESRPVNIAGSFEEFIFEICLGTRLPDYAFINRAGWEAANRRVFEPVRTR